MSFIVKDGEASDHFIVRLWLGAALQARIRVRPLTGAYRTFGIGVRFSADNVQLHT